MKSEQSTVPDDWDDVLEACRPHLAALLDTQRDPTARPVYADDPALHTAGRNPAQRRWWTGRRVHARAR
ncbi:hypothetical protein ACIP5L_27750 [Streptomyces bacillaris]|uniref:hypothetical protein n=1 Tax=Streptomyces bacillaris TaxID=68179 RepID=UPI0037FE21F5